MKKSLAAALACAALALSACATGDPAPTPTATVTVAPSPSSAPHDHNDGTHEHPDHGHETFTNEAEEKAFLDALKDRLEALDPAQQQGTIAVGYTACESLDHGDSVESVITDATEAMGPDARALVSAAATHLCPAHIAAVEFSLP